jgi:hypothetical protein
LKPHLEYRPNILKHCYLKQKNLNKYIDFNAINKLQHKPDNLKLLKKAALQRLHQTSLAAFQVGRTEGIDSGVLT